MKNVKRVLIAAVVGAVIMFMWGGISHMIIIAGVGFKPLPSEDKITAVLKSEISQQGLYFFPARDFANTSKEHEAAWMEKFQNGPVGMLVYRPIGGSPFSPAKLVKQFSSHLLVCLIVSMVASQLIGGYWRKVLVISLLGAMACAAVSTIYWNWYEFPTEFYLAQWFDQVVGFFLSGLVISRFNSV